MQTATADPLVGRLLEGRYRIQARIARGGMSTVYSAVDERLDRLVAVKIMSAGLSADPAFADRFAREARAAAKLAHINTVAVYDQGSDTNEQGSLVFLVMELVSGRTLRDLLRERGRLSPAEAVSIMEPVLAALAVAHRAGLVHRDVKPENILLSDEGVVKVADFGLARAVESEGTATRTGLMMGTVAYCSPEQVTRGATDQRSDVYSAGIVLFEMLTGHAPYLGDSAMAVAYQHVHSRVPAPSSQQVGGIGEALDEIVVRATDSDPAGRPLDAGAFLAELADVRADLGLPVVPVPARPRPNGRRPDAGGADAATTERLSRSAGVHDTAVDATPLYAGPGGPPAGVAGPTLLGGPGAAPPAGTHPQRLAHRRRRRLGLIAIVLVLLLIGAAAGFAGWWFAAGRYERVPSVGGESRSTAIAALNGAGFHQITISQVNSDTVAKGSVVGTKPAGDTRVRRHAPITLLISLGPKLYTLPDVQGGSEAKARAALDKLPVQISTKQQPDDNAASGTVLGTDPPAGTQVRADQSVTIIVSSGPPILDVPDVTNDSQDKATSKLQDAGFHVKTVEQFSESVDSGKVISQEPGANSTLPKGETVTITVSQGPPLVTIPNISPGAPVDEVRSALRDLGLDVRVRKEFGGALGKVVGLDPPSGSQVPKGDTVTLYVV